jgi:hypothetical protein
MLIFSPSWFSSTFLVAESKIKFMTVVIKHLLVIDQGIYIRVIRPDDG